MVNLRSDNKGIPPLRVWELDENSTRYDYVLAAPSDTLLVKYWFSWSAIASGVSIFVSIVFFGLVTSRKARKHPFNVYLIYLMIPDILFSLLCSITCLINAINGQYWSTALCNFQSLYIIWGIGSNMWINTIIAYQIHKMCKDYNNPNKQYRMPSKNMARNQALAVYIYTGCLGCLGFIKFFPIHSAPMSGLACLPVEINLQSSFFFWPFFFPLFCGIPVLYPFYIYYDVTKRHLLPSEGKVRNVILYFGKIILVFIGIWVPSLVLMFVLPTFVPYWAHFVGGTISHIQGLFSAIIALGKPDVYCATKRFITCKWWYDNNNDNDFNNADNIISNFDNEYNNDDEDDDDESSLNLNNLENYRTEEFLLPTLLRIRLDHNDNNNNNTSSFSSSFLSSLYSRFIKKRHHRHHHDEQNSSTSEVALNVSRLDASSSFYDNNIHHSSFSTDCRQWNNWAFPGPKRISRSGGGMFNNTGTNVWPNKDGSYRANGGMIGTGSMMVKKYRLDSRTKKLIKWNTQQLFVIMQKIVARRNAIIAANTATSAATTKTQTNNDRKHHFYLHTPFRKNNSNNKNERNTHTPPCNDDNNNEENNNISNCSDNSVNTPLNEVAEIISLPGFDKKATKRQQDPTMVEISSKVTDQLQDYITCIAQMYNNDNPFHNFDHACHVMMSVIKLMSRIVAPDNINISMSNHNNSNNSINRMSSVTVDDSYSMKIATASVGEGIREATAEEVLHDHTYGITSDPLTQFGCAFSALIHDVDHTGVPNNRLIQENTNLATTYNDRSVAEQNSFDISWNLLMQDQYIDLRSCLCSTPLELSRFRQIVINSVMATDIADKESKKLRNNRWDKAFNTTTTKEGEGDNGNSSSGSSGSNNFNDEGATTATTTNTEINSNATATIKSSNSNDDYDKEDLDQCCRHHHRDDVNRKATIVIEHLIQTADVSHTMQHWHVYLKWNKKLFMEMYNAYINGRTSTDGTTDNDNNPATTWYEGEIGFFDFYIIPLAKKMKECGVFGVSSDEYLYYATLNRKEWEVHGKEIVQQMLQNAIKEQKQQQNEVDVKKDSSSSISEEFNSEEISI